MGIRKTVSALRAETLKAIGLEPGVRFTTGEITARMPQELAAQVGKNIANMVRGGLLVQFSKERPFRYGLSEKGREILENLDSIPIAAPKTAQAPEQISLNISPTASSFADYASAILAENEQYRNLLLQVHHTIGHALGLNKE